MKNVSFLLFLKLCKKMIKSLLYIYCLSVNVVCKLYFTVCKEIQMKWGHIRLGCGHIRKI